MIPMISFFVVLVILMGTLAYLNTRSSDTTNTAANVDPNAVSQLYGGVKVASLAPSTQEILDDPNYQNIILPDELKQKIANKENFYVYFFASDCPHCRATTPQLMPQAQKQNVELHQFNLKEFEDGWRDYNIEFTPTLVYFEKGVEKERIVGGLKETGTDNGHTLAEFEQLFNKHKGNDLS
ncbi:thioredoxin family protein [Paenibacillus sp. JX-17]|uniref:Thioredoxin family protein n=2 Tax=Paenibacillus lacisoli TaxID=3064525 RepID=A0ABT9C9Q8_9BACL|nr:thioredoxin family protein [Paenibacillus sp. JX-17]MDO7905991.1 thioredoxin family protein [Paenibacillus sp. JX-17]